MVLSPGFGDDVQVAVVAMMASAMTKFPPPVVPDSVWPPPWPTTALPPHPPHPNVAASKASQNPRRGIRTSLSVARNLTTCWATLAPMDLFARSATKDRRGQPLAERMRPRTLREFVGQAHLLGPGKLLRRALEASELPSLILWGPPGTGKTTLGRLLAAEAHARFVALSAVMAGVKELREAVAEAATRRDQQGERTVLFVDEIHRFNKAQQDALLPHVEAGTSCSSAPPPRTRRSR